MSHRPLFPRLNVSGSLNYFSCVKVYKFLTILGTFCGHMLDYKKTCDPEVNLSPDVL